MTWKARWYKFSKTVAAFSNGFFIAYFTGTITPQINYLRDPNDHLWQKKNILF